MPPKLRGAVALATANALATAAHTLAAPPAIVVMHPVAPVNVPPVPPDHLGTVVQIMQQMQQMQQVQHMNMQQLQAQRVATVPPAPLQPITTLTEEGEKKKSWLASRERYVGPYDQPCPSGLLLTFLRSLLSGSVLLATEEAARWKKVLLLHPLLFDFILGPNAGALPVDACLATKSDYRVVLSEIAALQMTAEKSRLGIATKSHGGLALAFSCPPHTFEIEKLETIKGSPGTSPVSLILLAEASAVLGEKRDREGNSVATTRPALSPSAGGLVGKKLCSYCNNVGHEISECRKKAHATARLSSVNPPTFTAPAMKHKPNCSVTGCPGC